MRNLISFLIDDFHERPLPGVMLRDQALAEVPGHASVVIGMRRAGKTFYCFQQIHALIGKGVERNRILYLNFEDERLRPIKTEDLRLIADVYFEKYPTNKDRECYWFFDEIQGVPGWESFVRRLLDQEQVRIYLTGSSSRLLSTEIATQLRGRSVTTEIFPFNFGEFLRFHGIKHGKTLGSRTEAALRNGMTRYLATGGFPAVQGVDEPTRNQMLQGYVDTIVFRDVVERYRIANTQPIRAMIRHAMNAPAGRFTINKFYNDLRSQGIGSTKGDLYEFLEHLQEAYLLYVVSRHSRSAKVRAVNPKKLYTIDTGLLHAMAYREKGDRGGLLESLVFMALRREGASIEYYQTKAGQEVDFLVSSGTAARTTALIQVCWSLENADTAKREIGALIAAMAELKHKRGVIVTWMDEKPVPGQHNIRVIPAWKWMLEGEEDHAGSSAL